MSTHVRSSKEESSNRCKGNGAERIAFSINLRLRVIKRMTSCLTYNDATNVLPMVSVFQTFWKNLMFPNFVTFMILDVYYYPWRLGNQLKVYIR